jgi:riboflavin biosynthesis pyrimidine reductase
MMASAVSTEPIRTLFYVEPETPTYALPEELRSYYDGDLRFPSVAERPYVIANFVSTLDGAVSFNIPGLEGGGPISGANDGDKFIMGLLRASADAVLVASGTVNAVSPAHLWLPEYVHPIQRDSYSYYRSISKKTLHPLIAIISGTGKLELNRAVFRTPGVTVVVITTEEGASHLHKDANSLPSTTVRSLPAANGRIAPREILMFLRQEFGVALVLTEGGPTLFGEFVTCGLVDELFLTIAPQIAGRVLEHPRPALVEGAEFTPATAPWLKLLSAKKAGDHLYLRYRRRNESVM